MSGRTANIRDFRGIGNVADPERLPLGWLREATNVDVTPQGAVTRRPGYTKVMAGSLTGGYATTEQDSERLYVVDGGTLKQVHADMSATDLVSGLSDASMYWAEVNGATYFSNGPDKGIIQQDGTVLPWSWPEPYAPMLSPVAGAMAAGRYGVACTFTLPDGRETGASEVEYLTLPVPGGLLLSGIPQVPGLRTNVYISAADSTLLQHALTTALGTVTWNASPDVLGEELLTHGLEPVPASAIIPAVWQGQIWIAEHAPASNVSAVWASEPLGFHLFNLHASFLQVPGEVTMLLPHRQGLVIGTRSSIYMWSDNVLSVLANYGIPEGHPGAVDRESGDCFFWTDRGMCRALPFENLTSGRLHVDPGTHASTAIVQHDGLKKLVTTTRPSGAVFNQKALP